MTQQRETDQRQDHGWTSAQVGLPGGRLAEVLSYGADRDGTLVLHLGTPGGIVPREDLGRLCDAHGLRLIQVARPGYGASSPQPGRVIADVAADLAAILDHLGVDTFITLGGSGGGPHAIACAALLPDRCRAAAAFVSPAPIDADGLDYYAGMGEANVEEWKLAEQGREVIGPWLQDTAAALGGQDLDAFADQYATAFAPVDLEFLRAQPGDTFAVSLDKAISTGIEGWLADDIALVSPWGFDLGAISAPVSLWTGKLDRMVSYRHSLWLAEAIPGSDLHVLGEHGHMSIQGAALPLMVQDLLRRSSERG